MATDKELLIDPQMVRDRLSYDPATGHLRWKYWEEARSQWNAAWAGKIAGSLNSDGYLSVGLCGHRFQAHRLAWVLVTGSWPVDLLDHRNGRRDDNRLSNLREASTTDNCRNVRIARNNTSGLKGVCFCKDTGKWQAQIRIGGGRRLYLGQHPTAEEAHAAYVAAALQHHGDFAKVA